jgi:hypothetical protein
LYSITTGPLAGSWFGSVLQGGRLWHFGSGAGYRMDRQKYKCRYDYNGQRLFFLFSLFLLIVLRSVLAHFCLFRQAVFPYVLQFFAVFTAFSAILSPTCHAEIGLRPWMAPGERRSRLTDSVIFNSFV